jgi:hypothetical protein
MTQNVTSPILKNREARCMALYKQTFCPSKRRKSLHVDGRLWCGAGSAECGVD